MAAAKNSQRLAFVTLAIGLLGLVAARSAVAGGASNPGPPDYLIEIVPGIPLTFDLEELLPANTEAVQFKVDGKPFVTDDFAPYGDYISTKFIERRGVSLETTHDFTVVAEPFLGEPVIVAEWHLLVHRMPVISRFVPLPLVRRKRRQLVGFQIRNVAAGSKVKAWGQGFQEFGGRQELRLRLIRINRRSRTYTVRGGLTWRHGAAPRVTLSVHPGYRLRNGVSILGRLYHGALRTTRDGDTNLRRIGSPDWCTYEISRRHRPPPRRSCDHF